MTIDRVKVQSTGFTGGPGVTNFYFVAVTASNLTALGAFFTALKPYIPNTVTYTIPSSGDTIDDGTGDLVAGWTAGAPAPVQGSGVSMAAMPAGFFVDWRGVGVVDGRRPVGKTIIVPAATAAFSTTDGRIVPATVTAVNAAAATFLSSTAGFCIWHRPRPETTGPGGKPFRPGTIMAVASGSCNAKPTVLRSRRD